MVTQDAAEKLVHGTRKLVTSRPDYCNSVLYGLPSSAITQLQRVQNWAARIVTRSHKFDHIVPVDYSTFSTGFLSIRGLPLTWLSYISRSPQSGPSLHAETSCATQTIKKCALYERQRFGYASF